MGLLSCRSNDAAHGEALNTACKQSQAYTLAVPNSVAHKQKLNLKMVEGQEDK